MLIAAAAVSWGTTGSVTAVLVARAGASALVIGAGRMAVGAALLVILARWVSGPVRIAAADRWRCAALGVCMAAFQVTYFSAVTRVGIALAALIAICGAPLMIAAFAAVILGERLTARSAVALALGVAGTALLVSGPPPAVGDGTRFASGVLLALGASLGYALYVVLAKAMLARMAPLPLAAVAFGIAAAVLAPALAVPEVPRQVALGWPWFLYLGAITTAGAYAIYTIGLRDVPASAAGIAALMEPLTATTMGMLLFGERLGPAGAAGAVLLFGALGLLLTQDGRA